MLGKLSEFPLVLLDTETTYKKFAFTPVSIDAGKMRGKYVWFCRYYVSEQTNKQLATIRSIEKEPDFYIDGRKIILI